MHQSQTREITREFLYLEWATVGSRRVFVNRLQNVSGPLGYAHLKGLLIQRGKGLRASCLVEYRCPGPLCTSSSTNKLKVIHSSTWKPSFPSLNGPSIKSLTKVSKHRYIIYYDRESLATFTTWMGEKNPRRRSLSSPLNYPNSVAFVMDTVIQAPSYPRDTTALSPYLIITAF